jgi:cation transport ATPase
VLIALVTAGPAGGAAGPRTAVLVAGTGRASAMPRAWSCDLHNVCVKGSSHSGSAARIDTAILDKTGTRTRGEPDIHRHQAVGGSRDDVRPNRS